MSAIKTISPKIDYDLANFNHLSPLNSPEGTAFDGFMRKIAARLTQNQSPTNNLLQNHKIAFCLQNRPDSSIARISSTQYKTDASDLSGNDFVVIFNKEKLSQIKTEDELAFILAHELSHLQWQHNDENVRNLNSTEEVACDINAVHLLKNGNYSVSIVNQIDGDAPLTQEWQQRKNARRQTSMEYFDFTQPTPLNQDTWKNASFTPWKQNFKIPDSKTPEPEAIQQMLSNLQMVYTDGNGDELQSQLKNYLQSCGSEQASRFFLVLSAKAAEHFPPIDQDSKNKDYRQKSRHPISILGNSIPALTSMSGKKLYPPEACQTLNRYFQQNPDYYRNMQIFWNKALHTDSFGLKNQLSRN